MSKAKFGNLASNDPYIKYGNKITGIFFIIQCGDSYLQLSLHACSYFQIVCFQSYHYKKQGVENEDQPASLAKIIQSCITSLAGAVYIPKFRLEQDRAANASLNSDSIQDQLPLSGEIQFSGRLHPEMFLLYPVNLENNVTYLVIDACLT